MKKKRQYRSNQGRSPEKEKEIFKTLNVAIKVVLIVSIVLSLTFLILE